MVKPAVDPDETRRSGGASRTETSDLAQRIARARGDRRVEQRADAGRQKDMTAFSRGIRIGAEFIAAILVGAGLGFLFDLVFKTSPWGMLGFFMLGFAAGILNVTRVVAEMNKAAPPPPPGSDLGPDEEEDEA